MNYCQILRLLWRPTQSKIDVNHLWSNRLLSRGISSSVLRNSATDGGEDATQDNEKEETPKYKVHPSKDRSRVIPYETSVRYLESNAYKETYGNELVWKLYRRNHKYAKPRLLTRQTCIMHKVITVGSPCPICRDEYLVLDYRNIKLLKQFLSPHTDEVIDAYFTGLCQMRHFELLVAVERARDHGLLPFYVPKRIYNYEDYYPQHKHHC